MAQLAYCDYEFTEDMYETLFYKREQRLNRRVSAVLLVILLPFAIAFTATAIFAALGAEWESDDVILLVLLTALSAFFDCQVANNIHILVKGKPLVLRKRREASQMRKRSKGFFSRHGASGSDPATDTSRIGMASVSNIFGKQLGASVSQTEMDDAVKRASGTLGIGTPDATDMPWLGTSGDSATGVSGSPSIHGIDAAEDQAPQTFRERVDVDLDGITVSYGPSGCSYDKMAHVSKAWWEWSRVEETDGLIIVLGKSSMDKMSSAMHVLYDKTDDTGSGDYSIERLRRERDKVEDAVIPKTHLMGMPADELVREIEGRIKAAK